jgi:hypothetical protein
MFNGRAAFIILKSVMKSASLIPADRGGVSTAGKRKCRIQAARYSHGFGRLRFERFASENRAIGWGTGLVEPGADEAAEPDRNLTLTLPIGFI